MIIIADNLRITNRIIEKALAESDPVPVRKLAEACKHAGADYIDINPGPLKNDPFPKMTFLVETTRSACDLPVLIDTVNPAAIEAGLIASQGEAIINGFSLEPLKLETILPLAKKYNAPIIGYLLRPDGHMPASADERMMIAVELFNAFEQTGLHPDNFIVDPIISPLLWQDGLHRNRELLTVIRNLPDLLGFPVKTIAGLSNLTADSPPGVNRESVENSFLAMMAASGLDLVLMNVLNSAAVETANSCHMLISADVFAWPMINPVL